MIDKLVHDLAAGSELNAEEILDVLWLSAIHPVGQAAKSGTATSATGPSAPVDEAEPRVPEQLSAEAAPSAASPQDGLIPLRLEGDEPEGGGRQVSATEVGFGSPGPIRGALALPRALRRFRQIRVPGHHLTVDIDATVDATAEAGRLMAVFTHPPERGLDLVLVIDGSSSMRIWDDTFDEFERLLAQTGAFRSVSRWRLTVHPEGVYVENPIAGSLQSPRRLIDPSGRRVVLVATDASHESWYTGSPWDTIATWCAAMPTALIQVLPPRYWGATAIGDPYITARARRPAVSNSEYARSLAWWAADPGGLVLPVVTLAPEALDTWAQAAVSGTAWATGITATPPDPQYAPSAVVAQADPAILVNDFLSRASSGAEHLAHVLANAATLSLPLISVLQEQLAPETGVTELAEIMASRLLEEARPAASRQPLFRYRPGTREILQRGATSFEEWDAYAAVSRYLAERQRLGGPLRALIPDPAGSARLDPADEPFADLRQALATRLGLAAPVVEPTGPAAEDLGATPQAEGGSFASDARPIDLDPPAIMRIGAARLTAGLDRMPRLDLDAHREVFGPLPRLSVEELISMAEQVDLRGQSGAVSPFARKLRAVVQSAQARDSPTIVVVNAVEGEPGSVKDKMLMIRSPYLILSGAALVAEALDADEVIVGVAGNELANRSIEAAIAAEPGLRKMVRVVQVPDRFISGESGALISGINGKRPIPPTKKVRPSDSGVDGLPTLLSNASTFAQLAVLALLGPDRFAAVGTADEPGTILLSVGGSAAHPAVVEVPTGLPLAAVLDICRAPAGDGVLVGGYFGVWLPAETAYTVPISREGLAEVGGTLGQGIVLPLGDGTCSLGEVSRIASYLAGELAGQCDPCELGLPAIVQALAAIIDGSGGTEALDTARQAAGAVAGQGACSHLDGVARFVLSALDVFTEDLTAHVFHSSCGRPVRGVLPLPADPEQEETHERRVELSPKAALREPYETYKHWHAVGETVRATVSRMSKSHVYLALHGDATGVIHVGNLTHDRVDDPADVLAAGDEVEAKIINFDDGRQHVELSLKEVLPNPYLEYKARHMTGETARAQVTRTSRSHLYVRLPNGTVGIIHVGQISHERVTDPSRHCPIGSEVTALITKFDDQRNQVELSIKALLPKPYTMFRKTHAVGQVVAGVVTNTIPALAFVDLGGGVQGSIHVSQLASYRVAHPDDVMTAGQAITAVIVAFDDARERVQLSLNQLP